MLLLLLDLKKKTESQHLRIETDLDLLSPQFDLHRYQSLLQRFLGYYSPWEEAVQKSIPSLLVGRSKVENLHADLRYLNPDLSSVTLCDSIPQLETRAQVLGSLYVVEGSTLGGQILRRHFVQKFGFTDQGCRFFSGYGDRTGSMWKQFGQMVNGLPSGESDEAVGAAIATFESMHDWLCQ